MAGTDRRSPRPARSRSAARSAPAAGVSDARGRAGSHPLRVRVRRRRELRRIDELELAARALVEALRVQAHDLGRLLPDAELHAVARLQLTGALAVALEQQRR